MAIIIPHQAYLSFSYKQCINTLHRIGRQLEEHWHNREQRDPSLAHLKGNLETLLGHEDSSLKILAEDLLKLFPETEMALQSFLMKLERENQIDIKESEFLVTTKDTDKIKKQQSHEIHIILDNIRSSFNVGSIMRTAEAFGVSHLHFCGYTPTPENSKAAKSALGAENWVSWKYWESTLDCLNFCREKGHSLYALETAKNSSSLNEVEPQFPCALVLGNERFGLSDHILGKMDQVVQIDLYGKKNSLNVGTCAAIGIHHFLYAALSR